MNYRIRIYNEERVHVVESSSKFILHQIDRNNIILKCPGNTGHVVRSDYAYSPAEFVVYKILNHHSQSYSPNNDGVVAYEEYEVEEVVRFPVKKGATQHMVNRF